MRSLVLTVQVASFASACDAEPSEPPPLPAASYTLSDATLVEIDGRGALSLSREGRGLGGTAVSLARPPTGRTFNTILNEALGSYRFRRSAVEELPASRFVGSEQRGESVVLRFEGDAGVRAELEIAVHTAARATRLRFTMSGAELDSIALPMACDTDASFLGFGEQYDDLDQRGDAFALFVEEQGIGRTGGPLGIVGDAHTTYFAMPYWLDLRGFGVLADTDARTLVDLCQSDPDAAWVEVEDDAPLDFLVFHGPTPTAVVEQLGDVVGRPGRPPDWAFERPWIGIQGGQDAVLAEADALEAAGIPVAALWAQDWSGRREFAPGRFGVVWRWVPDTSLYPDLRGLTDTLHGRGLRFLAYANPFVVPELDHFDAMRDADLLIRDASGAPLLFQSVSTMATNPDFTRPETYTYVEGFFRSMVDDLGIDGWMADYGEWLPLDAQLFDGSDARLAHNTYPTAWHRASRQALDASRPDGDYVLFTRSGWTREQGVAQIVWCGDQEADFTTTDGLPTVVPAMLNLGVSGIPFVTHDIAGFSGGPSTKELYLRWVELGALSPIMRTHEGLMREANWSWDRDAESTAHFLRFARLHETLAPEILAAADLAASTGMPIVRALSFVFPDDPGSRGVWDQYLLGDDLLVAPVLEEGVTRRALHLPPGTWFHVWTGARHEGPIDVEVDAPLGSPPLFSRGEDRPALRE